MIKEIIKSTLSAHQDPLLNYPYRNEIKILNGKLVFYNMDGQGVMLGFMDFRIDPIVNYKYSYLPPCEEVPLLDYENVKERTITFKEIKGIFKNDKIQFWIPFEFDEITIPRKFVATKEEESWGTKILKEFTEIPAYNKKVINKAQFKLDFINAIEDFTNAVLLKIYSNDLFLTSSGWDRSKSPYYQNYFKNLDLYSYSESTP